MKDYINKEELEARIKHQEPVGEKPTKESKEKTTT